MTPRSLADTAKALLALGEKAAGGEWYAFGPMTCGVASVVDDPDKPHDVCDTDLCDEPEPTAEYIAACQPAALRPLLLALVAVSELPAEWDECATLAAAGAPEGAGKFHAAVAAFRACRDALERALAVAEEQGT